VFAFWVYSMQPNVLPSFHYTFAVLLVYTSTLRASGTPTLSLYLVTSVQTPNPSKNFSHTVLALPLI